MKQQPMTKPVKGAGGRRLAAIDIGSNSIRCIVVETGPSSAFRILDDEKATVRLGEGLSSTGRISVQAQQRARDALLRMKKITEGLGVEVVETIATSAIRRAGNGKAFIEAIREDCGLDIRVISGEEEGELALESALHQFSLESGRNIVFDIGGGSVE
ncbi:MAG: Ppx/GppA phosphatase family protein, partial [Geoalkalibacter sp.]|uniref:Ppx/GppA phosphatase family protein n=1 Tax=Geoalkalibacter sp. TaxID=3041440 RepID=UPI003D10E778